MFRVVEIRASRTMSDSRLYRLVEAFSHGTEDLPPISKYGFDLAVGLYVYDGESCDSGVLFDTDAKCMSFIYKHFDEMKLALDTEYYRRKLNVECG